MFFFFFNDTATTEIYTLSLHDALPIFFRCDLLDGVIAEEMLKALQPAELELALAALHEMESRDQAKKDRKSTRLNSSHGYISYAVFCLKKKKKFKDYPILLTGGYRYLK